MKSAMGSKPGGSECDITVGNRNPSPPPPFVYKGKDLAPALVPPVTCFADAVEAVFALSSP
jgi:hypothetical protein